MKKVNIIGIEDGERRGVGSNSSSSSLFVSLYLVVLAFFIMLNSISKIQENKSEGAISSVRDTFSNLKHNKLLPVVKMFTQTGADFATESYYAPIKKIAQDAVTLVDADIIEIGDTMRISMPVTSFFEGGERYIKTAQLDFITKIAEELKKSSGGREMYVEFVIGFKDEAEITIATERAVEFAKALEKLKVKSGLIFIGITPESETTNKLSMTFKQREVKTEETE